MKDSVEFSCEQRAGLRPNIEHYSVSRSEASQDCYCNKSDASFLLPSHRLDGGGGARCCYVALFPHLPCIPRCVFWWDRIKIADCANAGENMGHGTQHKHGTLWDTTQHTNTPQTRVVTQWAVSRHSRTLTQTPRSLCCHHTALQCEIYSVKYGRLFIYLDYLWISKSWNII